MKTFNMRRRLEALEEQLTSEPIVLLMPDGRTETLPGHNDFVLNLLSRDPWGPDAGDGTRRAKRQLYRAGRCTYGRPGSCAVERTSGGHSVSARPSG